MIVKIHKNQEGKTVVSCCDKELVGQKFEEGELQLDLSSDFYKGDDLSDTEAGDLIRNADGVNLVGEKSVKIGVEEGVIDKENVKRIKDIPYAQGTIIHE